MGTTLVEYQLEQMEASRVSGLILVVGHEAEAVRVRVAGRKGVKIVENRDYWQGAGLVGGGRS